MPLYEFTNKRHGLRVLVPFAVERRQSRITLRRAQVPSGLTVGVGSRAPTISDKLAKGYKHLEAQGKLSDKNPNYLPAKTIKAALALPETT